MDHLGQIIISDLNVLIINRTALFIWRGRVTFAISRKASTFYFKRNMFIILPIILYHCFPFCYVIINKLQKQKRAHLYSSREWELIIEDCRGEKLVLTVKSNTAAAAKLRQCVWQKITHKLNDSEDFSLESWPIRLWFNLKCLQASNIETLCLGYVNEALGSTAFFYINEYKWLKVISTSSLSHIIPFISIVSLYLNES